jgi:NDP-sugar pyrophosphorylase family protein
MLQGGCENRLRRDSSGNMSPTEKPEIASPVSMGTYVIERSVIEHIPEARYFGFPDLIRALIAAGEPVGVDIDEGLRFEIGRPGDYTRAVSAWSENGTSSEETKSHVRYGDERSPLSSQ